MTSKSIADITSWFATIAAFLFACIGIFFQPPVLESSRPKLPTPDGTPQQAAQKTPDQRLAQSWDDPFVVFKPSTDFPPKNEDTQKHKAPLLLLVVLTETTEYQIAAEARLRHRYAIQSALRDAEYIPETPGELSTVPLKLPLGND
jgi:hypothetical protein